MRKLIERCVPLFMFSILFQSIGAQAETCEETLKLVQHMYNLQTDACGPDAASDCSGLLIRGTHRADPAKGQKWDVWNPSPRAVDLKSTAFSYFRKDIRYDNPGMQTQNGFITTPFDYLCSGQKGGHLQCAFPTDGWTDNRENGCGDSLATKPRVEKACQDMKINSGAAWFADFNKHDKEANFAHSIAEQSQCGFGMEQARGREGRKLAFKNFLDARKLVNKQEFTTQTEVRLSNPGTDQMPVLAFFSSDSRGDAAARANQIDYLRKTGNYRPIINIKFPVNPGDVATFSCAPNQAVPPAMSSSPGFCIAGKAPSPGFGSTTGTGANPAQYEAVANQFVNQTQAAAAAAAAAQAQTEAGFCPKYIAKSEWIKRDDPVLGKDTWSLSVTPTECGRKIGPAETDRMYAELYNKHSKDPQWREYAKNFGSMRRQLVCHLEATRGKIEWNLEPARPYVSQATAISLPSTCNAGPADKGK